MSIEPKFLATGIGSMPFNDSASAVDMVLSRLPQAPHWPQLPQLGLNEQMEIQFCEHMPCAVIDRERNRLYFDTSADYAESFAQFYETYLAAMDADQGNGDCKAMALSAAFASGLHALRDKLQRDALIPPFVKCQVVGPCTFSLTITDENKRVIYYNEEFRDMIVKTLAMTACWQVQTFRPHAGSVLCFIDEPILSAFGSSTYVAVQRADVVGLLAEMIGAVHASGGIAGIHCCGNTEWSILVDAGVDIVSFDAFQYGETIAMYAGPVREHLLRGGALAWGIVPTSTAISEQTTESLAVRLETLMDHLASRGIEKSLLARQALLTPSCGTGSMMPDDARLVYERLYQLSAFMKQRYGY